MRSIKRTWWALLLILALTVALSGCSVVLPALENVTRQEAPTTPGGEPGGDNPSGAAQTYTLDVAALDEYWYDNVVDSSLWRTTGTVGAYAKDTLVLNGDGTYALTKEMGADQASVDRWSSDGGVGDRNFNTYTYYGTYTVEADGVTVTLSPATSLAVEVDVFDMTVGYDLGSYPIDYTETDDLSFQAGTCNGELVTDFIVGPYIAASGSGNCAQTVVLGEYEYGTFTFTGAVDGGGADTPSGPSGPQGPGVTQTGYTFTSGANPEITFDVYPDGTYTFAWAANQVSESGTYVYDRVAQTLTFTDPAGKETAAEIVDGQISFTYYFSQTDQLNQAYTGAVAEMEAVILTPLAELIPTSDASVTLVLYADGTYTYTDGDLRETGAYAWSEDTLTLTTPAGETVNASNEGNLLRLTYRSGGSSQSYVASLAQLQAVFNGAVPTGAIYAFTPGANEAITFELSADGTYTFAWAENGVSEQGIWSYVGGVFSVTDTNGTVTTADCSGDEISFTYYFSQTDQLNQAYTGSASALVKAMVESGAAKEVYAFTPAANDAITFTLYDNGGYCFAWAANGVAEYGTWKYDGAFSVTDPTGKLTQATISGDEIGFTYYFSQTDQLNQAYTGSVAALIKGMVESGSAQEVYAFTPAANEAITFTLYDNGGYCFAWEANGVAEYGTWTFTEGVLAVTDPAGKVTEAAISGDEISFTYYFSQTDQLNQAYTGSASALVKAMVESDAAKVVCAFTPGANEAITFTLYSNGAYCFAWEANGVAEYGAWSYADGAFSVTDPNGKVTEAAISGDEISFTYYYSMTDQLNQAYTGSVAALVKGMVESGATKAVYAFTPGANEAITFTLYDSGVYRFAWDANGVAEYGAWSFDGGSFSVTDPAGKVTEAAISGDEISFTYYYSMTDQLNQAYTGSLAALTAAVEP